MTTSTDRSVPVYDHRRGVGPTLVFLHYWGGSARTWRLVLDRLPDRDALTIDARGWSRSRGLPGPYTLDRLADDTLAVITEAALGEHVLVGHSMGGKVAQLVAAGGPPGLRGLVLVGSGPAVPAPEVTPEYRAGLAHAYDSDESTTQAATEVLTATPLSDELLAQVVADSRASTDGAATEWPLHGIAEDVSHRTREITVPALVIAGENDRVEPVEVLRNNLLPYLSDAQITIVPRSGHLLPLEAPDDLAARIAAFVDRLGGR